MDLLPFDDEEPPRRPRPSPGRGRGRHRPSAGVRLRARLAAVFDVRTVRGRAAAAVVLVALVTLGALVLLLGDDDRGKTASPPTPPTPGSSQLPSSGDSGSRAGKAKPFACLAPKGSRFGGSAPTRICLPDIKIDADVMELGLNGDRTVQVPPLSRVGEAGWYKHSAAPGTDGSSVILGHVDSAKYGKGVFYDLGRLHRGDRILVTRGDGKRATYRVDRVEQIAKSKFPTQRVYGPSSKPVVRLVTCGGRFNSSTGSYVDNIIAFGTLDE